MNYFDFRSNSDSEDDIEPDTVDQEYPSLDSVPSDNSLQGMITSSPRCSEPPSLTESMQILDEILSDKTMDRIERIDKLEAILSAATLLPNDPVCLNEFSFENVILMTHFIHRSLRLFKVQTHNRIQAVPMTVSNSPRTKNRKSKTIYCSLRLKNKIIPFH